MKEVEIEIENQEVGINIEELSLEQLIALFELIELNRLTKTNEVDEVERSGPDDGDGL